MPIATIQTLKLLQLIRASINQLLSAIQTSPTQAFTQVQPRREFTNLSKCSIRQIWIEEESKKAPAQRQEIQETQLSLLQVTISHTVCSRTCVKLVRDCGFLGSLTGHCSADSAQDVAMIVDDRRISVNSSQHEAGSQINSLWWTLKELRQWDAFFSPVSVYSTSQYWHKLTCHDRKYFFRRHHRLSPWSSPRFAFHGAGSVQNPTVVQFEGFMMFYVYGHVFPI